MLFIDKLCNVTWEVITFQRKKTYCKMSHIEKLPDGPAVPTAQTHKINKSGITMTTFNGKFKESVQLANPSSKFPNSGKLFPSTRLTRIEQNQQYKQWVCTDKTIQNNGWRSCNKCNSKDNENKQWKSTRWTAISESIHSCSRVRNKHLTASYC